MAHQITPSDEDDAALKAASARTGRPVQDLEHQALASSLPAPQSTKQIGSYTYPTREPPTPEALAAVEELAQAIGSEKPWAFEIVIENRGPR